MESFADADTANNRSPFMYNLLNLDNTAHFPSRDVVRTISHPQRSKSLFFKKFNMKPPPHVIQTDFIRMLQCLSFFGYCPLNLLSLHGRKFRKARLNPITVASTFFAVWMIINYGIFSLSHTVGIAVLVDSRFRDFAFYQQEQLMKSGLAPSLAKILYQTLLAGYFFFPIFQVVPIVLDWIKLNPLILFLNRWKVFESRLQETFPFAPFDSFKDPGVTYVTYVKILSLPILAVAVWDFGFDHMTATGPYQSSVLSYNFVFATLLGMDMFALSHFADLKTKKMCQAVVRAYEMVNDGILFVQEQRPKISAVMVQDWRKLIIMIRDQTQVGSDHAQITQSLFVLQCIFFTTVSIFVSIGYNWSTDTQVASAVLWLVYAGGILFRLGLKAEAAQSVVEAEQRVLETIGAIDEASLDSDAVIQIQITKHVMEHDPNHVKFFRNQKFRTTIVLNVLHHVVTYVIVLVQSTGTGS